MIYIGRRSFLTLLSAAVFAGAVLAEPIYYFAPHHGLEVHDSAQKAIPGGAPDAVVTQNGLTLNIYYSDIQQNTNIGFDSPSDGANARARFQETLAYLADVLNESGTLDIVVNASQTDGTGALAFAGTFYSSTAGFQKGSTLQRLDSGTKPFAGTEEISVTVDFGYNWNFGAGDPAGNQADFSSVILHELTHGLGFASLSSASGASQISPNVFTLFDQLMRRNTGNVTLFSGAPPSFQGVAADLRSGDLFFAGAQADVLYAPAERPGLYAPAIFQSGSSLTHWDTGNIVGGAVMEHAIVLGTQRRAYAPLDIGGLVDIGYVNAAEGEGEGEGEPEGEGEETGMQTADQDANLIISLSELLRVIQFYNSLGLHCADSPGDTEDGFVPGPGGNQTCTPYDTDYSLQDWVISLSELLRIIQFYNSGGYNFCPLANTEDDFCPGV